MNLLQLQEQLAGLPVPQIRYFDSIGSTNDEALAWAASGAEDGCLVMADLQTRGRGRFGRTWVTRPGVSLAFSLILRPSREETQRMGVFSPLGALAICRALKGALRLPAQIKWPNDVLLSGRKTAGILVEAAWLGDILEGVVIGIGINVTRQAVPPDEEVLYPATSVEDALGRPVDRLALLRSVLEEMFAWRALAGSPAFHQAWEERLAFRGEQVEISETSPGSAPLRGRVLGISEGGGLLLELDHGKIHEIAVGDVHLRPRQ